MREYTLDCKPKHTAGRTACCCAGAGCGCGCGCHGAAGRHAACYSACPHRPPRPACARGLPAAHALGPPPCCAPRRSAPRPAAARDPCRRNQQAQPGFSELSTQRGVTVPPRKSWKVFIIHTCSFTTPHTVPSKRSLPHTYSLLVLSSAVLSVRYMRASGREESASEARTCCLAWPAQERARLAWPLCSAQPVRSHRPHFQAARNPAGQSLLQCQALCCGFFQRCVSL